MKMLPISPVYNAVNSLWVNAILFSQRWAAYAAAVKSTYFFYLPRIQLVRSAAFAAIIYNCLSALKNRISLIVTARSKEKMIRSNARWDIAIVADLFPIWDFPKMDFPRCYVSSNLPFIISSNSPISVLTIVAANPKPAFISFVNELPKPLFQWDSFVRVSICASTATKHLFRGDTHIEYAVTI